MQGPGGSEQVLGSGNLRKRRRLTIALASIGFAVTAVIYASIGFTRTTGSSSERSVVLGVIAVVLCPPGLLSIPLFDIEPYSPPGAALWLIIALMNSGLYGGVGTLVGRVLWKDRP